MYLAIDLGGTNIKAGLVDKDGNILARAQRPSGATRPDTEIVKDMAMTAIEAAQNGGVSMDEIESVGIGAPGTVDHENGVLVYANNLNFRNTQMRKIMQQYIQKPIYIGNDANCAALGEYAMMKEQVSSFAMVTLGTGVGGGLVLNDKLYTGFNGAGAEFGHMSIVKDGEMCSCGRPGCWEAYASVTGLINQTRRAVEADPDGAMAKHIGGDVTKIGGKTAFEVSRAGDAAATKVVDTWIEYVATGVVNLINILQPNIIAIGGAICKEGDRLLNPILEYAKKYRYSRDVSQTKIMIAQYGNDAGLIGAAFLGLH